MPWNILLSKDVQTRNLWLFYPILRRQVHRCSSYRFVVKDAFKIVHHIDQIHIFWWILCFMQQTEILGWTETVMSRTKLNQLCFRQIVTNRTLEYCNRQKPAFSSWSKSLMPRAEESHQIKKFQTLTRYDWSTCYIYIYPFNAKAAMAWPWQNL